MIRVGVISPEPTPYRAPLFDRISELPDVDLTVIYAAQTVAAREWTVELGHRAIVLDGWVIPARRLLRHDYPVTPSIWRFLRQGSFDCVVAAGWSVFASQAAIAWARLHHVPYIVMAESHLLDRGVLWKRWLKRRVLPRALQPAAGVLVTGSLAADAMRSYGVPPERIRIFANTVDVEVFGAEVDTAREGRSELRAGLGLAPDEVVALHVGRLSPEKGADLAIRAASRVPGLRLVIAGSGPQERELRALAAESGEGVRFAGFVAPSDLPRLFAVADVFVLLSRSEPWGVAVNEAAAAGLPLVLSDRVGAAHDLLRDGENGALVPSGDVEAAVEALRRLVADDELRRTAGRRSRQLVASWGYEPSVCSFHDAVKAAVRG